MSRPFQGRCSKRLLGFLWARGTKALFWSDRWIEGESIKVRCPNLWSRIRPGIRNKCTVQQALANGKWIRDVGPDLGEAAILEFLWMWGQLQNFELQPEVEDAIRWEWSSDGVYSAKSACMAFYAGRELAPAAKMIWNSRAPMNCRLFAWLASRNRCWTADRLAKRGLPHPTACPLCD